MQTYHLFMELAEQRLEGTNHYKPQIHPTFQKLQKKENIVWS
jgi:hypothetical protein